MTRQRWSASHIAHYWPQAAVGVYLTPPLSSPPDKDNLLSMSGGFHTRVSYCKTTRLWRLCPVLASLEYFPKYTTDWHPGTIKVGRILLGGRQVLPTSRRWARVGTQVTATVMITTLFWPFGHLHHKNGHVHCLCLSTTALGSSVLHPRGWAMLHTTGFGSEWADIFMAEQSFACNPLTLPSL